MGSVRTGPRGQRPFDGDALDLSGIVSVPCGEHADRHDADACDEQGSAPTSARSSGIGCLRYLAENEAEAVAELLVAELVIDGVECA